MARFRNKPIVIEAVKWTGDNIDEIIAFMGVNTITPYLLQEGFKAAVELNGLFVPTLEGPMFAHVNDWIIRGVKGELYPCDADIFCLTYEHTI